jgi:hypothetical protein
VLTKDRQGKTKKVIAGVLSLVWQKRGRGIETTQSELGIGPKMVDSLIGNNI